ARTEGWAAGLRLAALAVPRGASAAAVERALAAGPQAQALEYLLDEVLGRQPPAFQDALLRTALPERLCPPLCPALLSAGGGADDAGPAAGEAFLAAVRRGNLFLTPLDGSADAGPAPGGGGVTETWYRYHALFRALLLAQGRARLGPAAVAALHARAGAWL